MKRRLANFGTLLTFTCFLLFLLLTIFWVRSYFGGDSLNFASDTPGVISHGNWGRGYRINSIGGYLQWIADDSWPTAGNRDRGRYWQHGQIPPWSPAGIPIFWCGTATEQAGALGFQWDVYRGRSGLSSYREFGPVNPATQPILARRLTIPYWFPLVLLAPGAFLWLRTTWRHYRSSRWRHKGQCSRCGYDLRATPDRCPECGRLTSTATP